MTDTTKQIDRQALLALAANAGFSVVGASFVIPKHNNHITAEIERFAELLAARATPSPVPAEPAEVGTRTLTDEVQFLRNIVNDAKKMLHLGTWSNTADVLEAATKAVERAALASRPAPVAAAPSAAQAAGVDGYLRVALAEVTQKLEREAAENLSLRAELRELRATTPSEGVAAPVEASDLHSFDTIRKAFDEQNEFYEFPSEDHRHGALNFFGWGWQAAAKLAASAHPSADQVRDAALEEVLQILRHQPHAFTRHVTPLVEALKHTTASGEQSAGGFGGGARNSDGLFVISTGGGGARNSNGSFVISAAGGGVPGARGAGGEKGADRG